MKTKTKMKRQVINISEQCYKTLKEYCNSNQYKIKGFVEKLITEKLSPTISNERKPYRIAHAITVTNPDGTCKIERLPTQLEYESPSEYRNRINI